MSKKKSKKNPYLVDINKINFFYGVPHCHTNISTGKGSPSECIEMAYRNDLDFLILTDHNSAFEKDTKMSHWSTTNKLISKYNKRASIFLVLHGFETHSSEWGHFNIINPKNYFSGTVTNINALVLWSLKDKNTLISINHPHNSVLEIPFSPLINTAITNIEVANGIFGKKYTKHDKIYYNMLDKGWKLSSINGQDNHKLNIGKEENLTAIISPLLTEESLIYALKNHHTFSTESKSLKMYFTINSAFMGSTILAKDSKLLKFFVNIEDSIRKISKVQIITSTGRVVKEISNLEIHTVKFMYQQIPSFAEKWYVVKILLNDKREAISSPIFLEF
ncbi:CehA/McbA family metallohydrolase [uncultured Clostridium sp.]|uniref:CehA/McbA family metallohydrolase n=1 Tax=uncultured Clostridium sp. TaxID=59620 RepID=UPI00260D8559|nr:CehA/McbA family metallohydrolase [uncultured Clostridium sp.]